MMRSRCSGLVFLALAAGGLALLACEDEARVVQELDSTSVAEPAQPGSSLGGSTGGAGQTEAAPACVPASCPPVTVLGNTSPGCCQDDGTCGGVVVAMGRALCAPPPNVDNPTEGDGVAGAGNTPMQLRAETVQLDATCSERNILGAVLPGCCDQTGVCGVSTAPVASGSPGAFPGLELPVTCVSPQEAAQLGAGRVALGSMTTQPCGRLATAPDAGALPPPVVPPAPPPVVPPAPPPVVPPAPPPAEPADAGDAAD